MGQTRFEASALVNFALRLLTSIGLQHERASDVAEILVEGDLLGHDTHGLALLAGYLAQLENGGMALRGEPRILATRHCVATWDGDRLPGPWLMRRALGWASERAREYGSATIAIRRSHHIG